VPKRKLSPEKILTPTVKEERDLGWEIVHHRTTILMIISIPFAFYIASWFERYVYFLNDLGYLGVLIAGSLYTYSTTAMPAAAVILVLGKAYNPFIIASIGALGALLSDYLIFRFVKDNVVGELHLLAEELHIRISKKKIKSKWITWGVGIIAAMIIASPLPDAIGIALLAVANYKVRNLALISYPMNFFGLLTLATVGSLV
jgi:hypothetical protein